MNRGFSVFMIVMITTLSGLAMDYYYYNSDSGNIYVDVCDTLVAVRLDAQCGMNEPEFAVNKPYLLDDFEFKLIGPRFAVYGLEPGYDLETAIEELRYDDAVLMVNPVPTHGSKVYFMSNQAVLRRHPWISADSMHAVLNAHGFVVNDSIWEEDPAYFVQWDGRTWYNLLDLCNQLYLTGIFQYGEPNFAFTSEFFCGIPQDPYFGYQWHHHNTGQSGGTVDVDIDMPETWDLMPEKMRMHMAIIDCGYDMNHEDLESGWCYWPYVVGGETYRWRPWRPEGEPPPPPYAPLKRRVHGTMSLGLVAPMIDDTIGLAGIETFWSIIPVKMCDIVGDFDYKTLTKALEYVVAPHGARVISCGFHLGEFSAHVETELKNIYKSGCAVFFAAGNDGVLEYPASSPYVFAVGATDHNDQVCEGSGYGSGLDICAPGKGIWSFDLTGADGMNNGSLCNGDADYYCNYEGTSCSVAIVAAIAAKMLATRPDLVPKIGPPDSLYSLLAHSAKDLLSPGHDYISGWGRVSALRALFALWRGDVNHDFKIDVSDALYIINNVFIGGPDPIPYFYLGDANCDASVDVSDAVWIINYVFVGGDPPPVCYSNLPD